MTLDEFAVDGRVLAAASVFPVSLDIHSSGRSPVRFMLLNHPDGSWWAAAWCTVYTSSTPELILLERVVAAHAVAATNITLSVTPGDDTSSHVIVVRPSSGGCCGSRLKSWQPFGTGVQMVYKPYNKVQV